jgi:hypothetical protein
MIEVEHSTQSLPALYSTTSMDKAIGTLQKAILQPLMIALFVVVRHVVRQRTFKRRSVEEDHPPGTLRLH